MKRAIIWFRCYAMRRHSVQDLDEAGYWCVHCRRWFDH